MRLAAATTTPAPAITMPHFVNLFNAFDSFSDESLDSFIVSLSFNKMFGVFLLPLNSKNLLPAERNSFCKSSSFSWGSDMYFYLKCFLLSAFVLFILALCVGMLEVDGFICGKYSTFFAIGSMVSVLAAGVMAFFIYC